MTSRPLLLAALPLLLVACATTGQGAASKASSHAPTAERGHASASHSTATKVSPYAPAVEDPSKRGDYVAGGLFRPGVADTVPDDIPDVDAIPEPEVRDEPRAATGNRDYVVLGKRYHVLDDHEGYTEEGTASYYGKKFHGRRTSAGEVYDMYAFTAAHKTLPLPSYARVTNLDNGKSVIVRVNDRGPFHKHRLIDLSYAAAVKLGYRSKGTARVRVEALQADEDDAPMIAATPSAMDALVGDLPKVTEVARPKATAEAARSQRFDMRQNGQVMGADEFDTWMRSRQIRVATGKPAKVSPAKGTPSLTPPVQAPVVAATPVVQVAQATQVAHAPSAVESGSADEQVTLQVASFASEQNARRALALLQRAAVAQARLQDAEVNGKKIWRLRIGPVDSKTTPELAVHVVGLGFGQPQRVRD